MIDIHCHILFSVDDGPNSVGESIMMLHMAYESGTRVIVATPHVQHVSASVEAVIWNRIQANFQELVKYAAISLPQLKLILGAEVMVTRNDCKEGTYLWHGDLNYGINASEWWLIEFPYDIEYSEMQKAVSDLIDCGKKPIIAHVEMYKCLRGDLHQIVAENSLSSVKGIFTFGLSRLTELKTKGAYLQISSGTINGAFDMAAYKWTIKAIENRLIDFVASDGHSAIMRKPVLIDAFHQISQQFGAIVAYKLFDENPSRMLDKSYVAEPVASINRSRKYLAAAALLISLGIGSQGVMGLINAKDQANLLASENTPQVNTVISEDAAQTDVAQSQAGEIELVEETVALGAPKIEGSSNDNLAENTSGGEIDELQIQLMELMDRYDRMATLLESEAKSLSAQAKTEDEKQAIIERYNTRIGDLEIETDRLFVKWTVQMEIMLKEKNLKLVPIEDAKEIYKNLKKEHRSALVD